VTAGFSGVRLGGGGTLPEPDHRRLVNLAGGGALAFAVLGLPSANSLAFPVLVGAAIGYPVAAAAFWYRRWSAPRG